MIAFDVGEEDSAGVDGRGAYEHGQRALVDNGAVEERTEVADGRLLDDLNAKESGGCVCVVRCTRRSQRIDADDDVGELGGEYVAVVVLGVLGPDDLHAVVAHVAPLADVVRIVVGLTHARRHVEHALVGGSGVVGRRLHVSVGLHAAHEALVRLELDRPRERAHELLVVGRAALVAQYGGAVLLALADVDHRQLVRLAARLIVEALELAQQLRRLAQQIKRRALLPRQQAQLMDERLAQVEVVMDRQTSVLGRSARLSTRRLTFASHS